MGRACSLGIASLASLGDTFSPIAFNAPETNLLWDSLLLIISLGLIGIGSGGITLPEQRFFVLLIERSFRIDRGVNEYSVPIDMHQQKIGDPVQMAGRRVGRAPS